VIVTVSEQESKAIGANDPRLSRAIFTLREAAGYLDVPKSTVHAWARASDSKAPLITTFPRSGAQATVPFIGFAEAYVLSAFRRAGVPLQRIRPAVEVLSGTIGIAHALASERLYTDGAEVLYDYAANRDEDELLELVVVRTGQHQFAEVVVDPHVAFGLPLVAHGGARVEDLVDRFVAGDSVADIADDFGVPADEVEDVIRVATRAAA
jgi:uncharacterized protein (DUF433 family)